MAPAEAPLSDAEVHLYRAPLDLPHERTEALWSTLSPDERGRAVRFRTEQLQTRFIAARGTLRGVLARYLPLEPGQLQFAYEAHGKPLLAAGTPGSVQFNLSHSHGLALLGVARRPLGVDVEWIRARTNAAQLIERFFSPDECVQWRGVAPGLQQLAFFQGWTRKEAWLKAIGSGLTFPLDQFSVSLAPGVPARLLSISGSAGGGRLVVAR